MSLPIPTFASAFNAVQNRIKATSAGLMPPGFHSDYEWLRLENALREQPGAGQPMPEPQNPGAFIDSQSGRSIPGFANGGSLNRFDPKMKALMQAREKEQQTGLGADGKPVFYGPDGVRTVGYANRAAFESGQRAVGGTTWSGPAIKDGQFFANTGATSFEMPKPGERRGPIGGRATPPAPDRFGHQFWKPTSPAPEGTTTSGGVSRAPMPWELPGYSGGGTIIGPGGPKDDMIPAMVDGIKPIAVSNGEEIVDAETRDYFGRKFFIDLKKKAEKGMEEAKGHTEMGHGEKPGFNIGGTIPAPTLAAMSNIGPDGYTLRGGKRNFADGGLVPMSPGKPNPGGLWRGPGGPKDDEIHAKVSPGEFEMPFEAVMFHGTKKLRSMIDEARESGETMNAMPGKETKRGSMPFGGTAFAEGGLVNPYADDPALYAQRQQQARDASLAMSGITDMGGGNRTLNNKYGTGFAVPTIQGLPDQPGRFNDLNGGTALAIPGKGLQAVPDVIPAGSPWGAPSLPWNAKDQQANIGFIQNQMIPGAEGRRADDLATATRQMAIQPKGRAMITVPNANPFPYGDHGGTERTGFRAPWEKDEQRRAERDAASPFAGLGLRKSDERRLMRSGEGQRFIMENKQKEAQRKSATTWSDVPNSDYQINELGNLVHKNTGKSAGITAEQAAALGLQLDSVDDQGRARWKRSPAAKAGKALYWDKVNRRTVEVPEGYSIPDDPDMVPLPKTDGTATTTAPAGKKPASRFLSTVK